MNDRSAMGIVYDDDAVAPSLQHEQAGPADDWFLFAVDAACVVALLAVFLTGIWLTHLAVAELAQRHPESFAFIMSPWVAPLLIGCGVVVLGGTAALLVFAWAETDREGGE